MSQLLALLFAMIVMLTVLCLSLGARTFPLTSSSSSACSDYNFPALLPVDGTIENLEKVLYHVALGKGVAPTIILNRLGRKIKARQRMNRMRDRNPLQGLSINELFHNSIQASRLVPSRTPSVFREDPVQITSNLLPDLPVSASSPRQFPFQPAIRSHASHSPSPAPFFFPVQGFKPPPGVTVRVDLGDIETQLPEVIVTLSPMMTVDEALRQADSKFRNVLGIPESEENLIAFNFSPFAACYVISRFNDVRATDQFAWKITVSDKNGQVIYDDVCLPSEKRVPVKPGTTISLSYSSL